MRQQQTGRSVPFAVGLSIGSGQTDADRESRIRESADLA
jgi:hypothetical protein